MNRYRTWYMAWRAGAVAVVLAIAVTLLAAASAMAAPNREQSNEFFSQAKTLIEKGDIAGAVIQLKNSLQNDPDNVAARYLLGEIYVRQGNGPSAEKELRKARATGLDEPKVIVLLGQAYLLQGKFQTVLDEIKSGNHDPAIEGEILLIRGDAYLGLGDSENGEATLREAMTSLPDDPRPHVALARSLVSRRELEKAEAEADKALKLDPKSAQAWVVKGELRRLDGDLEKSVENFGRALAINPNDISALLGHAATLVDLNRDTDAAKDLAVVRERVPNHPLATYLSALIAAKAGDFQKAEDMLVGAAAFLDNHMPSVFLLGAVHYAQGEYEQAENKLTRFVEAVPTHVAARKLLGAVLIRKGQPARAIEILDPLSDLAPNDAQALALLGSAYMQDRKFTKSMEFFEKAAEIAPDAASIRTQLALSRLATGESKAAVKDLEAAVDLNPDASRAGILLALTQLRNKKYDAALKAAAELETRLADNPLPFNLEGAALLGKGDTKGARAAFEKAIALQSDYFPARMNLAQLDLRDGDTDGAKTRFKKILELDPKHVGAMLALADLAKKEGRTDESIDWLEQARKANPKAIAPRLLLVDIYLKKNDNNKALDIARELDATAPNNPRVLDALARTQVATGEPNNAVATYRRLTRLAPKSGQVFHRLAAAQVAAEDFEGARESLATAVSVDPAYQAARVAQIELELRAKKPARAMELAEALRAEKPDSAVAAMLAGDAYVAVGALAKAVAAYRDALAREKNSTIAVRLHNVLVETGDIDAATAVLEDWLKAKPDDNNVRLVLAGTYLSAARLPDAIRHYEVLLAAAPDNPVLLNNLAWAYQESGDDRAVAYAEKAYAKVPDSVPIIDTLGWILVQRGKAARGLELLKKASAMAPQESEIRYHLAVALNALGERDAARGELETILRSGKDFGAADDARALLRELKGS